MNDAYTVPLNNTDCKTSYEANILYWWLDRDAY